MPDRRASSGLFGMILWTLLADDPRSWVFTEMTSTNTEESQRVFWLGDPRVKGDPDAG